MIISFSWTTPALLAGQKTKTRREWKAAHAERVEAARQAGKLFEAWNYAPRVVTRNPHQIAVIRLTEPVRLIRRNDLPPEDWEAEGFEYLTQHSHTLHGLTPRQVWNAWANALPIEEHYLVCFEVVEYLEGPRA